MALLQKHGNTCAIDGEARETPANWPIASSSTRSQAARRSTGPKGSRPSRNGVRQVETFNQLHGQTRDVSAQQRQVQNQSGPTMHRRFIECFESIVSSSHKLARSPTQSFMTFASTARSGKMQATVASRQRDPVRQTRQGARRPPPIVDQHPTLGDFTRASQVRNRLPRHRMVVACFGEDGRRRRYERKTQGLVCTVCRKGRVAQ